MKIADLIDKCTRKQHYKKLDRVLEKRGTNGILTTSSFGIVLFGKPEIEQRFRLAVNELSLPFIKVYVKHFPTIVQDTKDDIMFELGTEWKASQDSSFEKYKACAEYLLSLGANINGVLKTKNYWYASESILSYVSMNKDKLKFLLAHGADPTFVDSTGKSIADIYQLPTFVTHSASLLETLKTHELEKLVSVVQELKIDQ